MEKAIAILIGNENGELSLRDFLAKVPETIRMRIKPSLLRDKGGLPYRLARHYTGKVTVHP